MGKLAQFLKKPPLHPQWLILRQDNFRFVAENLPESGGILLDLNCGRRGLKDRVEPQISCLGLDYPATGLEIYHDSPDTLATATGSWERVSFRQATK